MLRTNNGHGNFLIRDLCRRGCGKMQRRTACTRGRMGVVIIAVVTEAQHRSCTGGLLMKTFRPLMAVLGFVILVSAGCGKSGGSSGPVSLSISPAEVVSGSCLNLEKLLDRTSAFPGDTVGRLYSTDIRVQADGARDVFSTLAARADFKFEESSYRDLVAYNHEIHFTTAKQNDCTHVTLYNFDGAPEDYAIVSATQEDLKLSDDADSKTAEISPGRPAFDQAHCFISDCRHL